MTDIEFGKRFSELLTLRNITNTKLTELAGVSKNNIGNYKNGQIPNASILYKLSQLLGVSMEYLIAGKEATNLTPEEQKLVEYYRIADDKSKSMIMTLAAAGAEQENKEITEQENSSTSKIG